jgi:hypothetical protein
MHDVHNIGNLEDKSFNLCTRMQFMSEKLCSLQKFLRKFR